MKRKHRFILVGLIAAIALGAASYWKLQADVEACADCLPAPLTLSSELFSEWGPFGYTKLKGKGRTVRGHLLWLGAYCEDGVIHNRFGRPVIFRQIDCEGPKPTPENDWDRRQQDELAKLREKHTVVTYCGSLTP
jgi:hypothetical protein